MTELALDREDFLASPDDGLDAATVTTRRARFGPNDIVEPHRSGWRALASDTARDPMLWFLAGAAGLFVLLGDRMEAAILLAAIVPLLAMDGFLHWRAQVSTRALSGRLAQAATVRREGHEVRLPARDLVPGDLVLVASGESFPADGVIVGGEAIQVDESSLTGESLPQPKRVARSAAEARASGEAHWARAGVRLLTGRAEVRILYTGADTLYGQISRLARTAARQRTPLQMAIARLVGLLLVAAVALCVFLAAVLLVRGEGLVEALLAAATLAVAALPEEYVVVFTFFLAAGVFRLGRRQALVRRAVAVENIGRASVICTDKTGTLTEGRLALEAMVGAPAETDLRLAMSLALRADSGDPLDEAALRAGVRPPTGRPLAVYPFTEDRRRETLVWPEDDGGCAVAVKGAPETVLALTDLSPEAAARWRDEADRLAGEGLKVIAYALRRFAKTPDAEPHAGLGFEGLAAFGDPIRPGVAEAVAACRRAGIRVVMVTGDHPGAARAIGGRLGIGGSSPRLLSLEGAVDAGPATDAELAKADLIARCPPADKLRLVRALQRDGEIVVVTGDGVNDVPALRGADIGVAMGEGASRSAREAAAIVLLDNNFQTLARAVAEGRQLFENLRLSFSFVTMVHIPVVLSAALVPLITGLVLYRPIHVVWFELIIHPTAMLAFQAAPVDGATAGPAATRRDVFDRRHWLEILGVGGLGLAAVTGSFLWSLDVGLSADQARTAALLALGVLFAAATFGLGGLRTEAGRLLALAGPASLLAAMSLPPLANAMHLAQPPGPIATMAMLSGLAAAAPIFGGALSRWGAQARSGA